MICYNNLTVNITESLFIFYYKMRSFADIEIFKKYPEGMRNISAGNYAKIFFMESKNSYKGEYKIARIIAPIPKQRMAIILETQK